MKKAIINNNTNDPNKILPMTYFMGTGTLQSRGCQ